MENFSLAKNQILDIDFLSDIQGLSSPQFIVEKLFIGGMGVCVKIKHKTTGRPFALKTIQRQFIGDDDAWLTFIEEMKTWITLSSCDGVAEAYCLVRINEIPYVCAEWMAGGDLGTQINNRRPQFFFSNVIRIARTLEWVHTEHRIIHRDLKPGNILLDISGRAFVADWGLARPIAKSESSLETTIVKKPILSRPELTQAGQMKGTIAYASPEQIEGRLDIDHRSDIYSFGCMLYRWATGVLPFVADTAEEIAVMHLLHPAPRIVDSSYSSSLGVGNIIAKCLEKDARQRYQTYQALVDELFAAAKKHVHDFEPYQPQQRYAMPLIGVGSMNDRIESSNITKILNQSGDLAAIEFDELAPFVREANALMALGDWHKASDVYRRLFVPEVTIAMPDSDYCQTVGVNYAICLVNIGKPELALTVLEHLENATVKHAAYFVNLSLTYLHLEKFSEAERTAKLGSALFPDDKDITGNLLIALTNLERYDEAVKIAKRRMHYSRDVHVLEEVATLLQNIGQKQEEKNLPNAVQYFKDALELLIEAREMNPRYATARFNLAKLLFDLRNYASASSELVILFNTVTLHPALQELIIAKIARCHDLGGEHSECLKFCDKWLETFPENLELRRVRAETIIDGFCIGKEKEGVRVVERTSLEFFEDIVERDGERSVSDLCYLARLYEWMGKFNGAFALLAEAETVSPGYWEIPYNRATILWRRNELESALADALVSCERAPWRKQNWWLLSKIYQGLGKATEAENAKQRTDDIDKPFDELFDLSLIYQTGNVQ